MTVVLQTEFIVTLYCLYLLRYTHNIITDTYNVTLLLYTDFMVKSLKMSLLYSNSIQIVSYNVTLVPLTEFIVILSCLK